VSRLWKCRHVDLRLPAQGSRNTTETTKNSTDFHRRLDGRKTDQIEYTVEALPSFM
jgi:hypothetical protein